MFSVRVLEEAQKRRRAWADLKDTEDIRNRVSVLEKHISALSEDMGKLEEVLDDFEGNFKNNYRQLENRQKNSENAISRLEENRI